MCNSFLLLSVFVLFLVFKREFLHVALVVVELSLQTSWPLTRRSTCLCLPRDGNKGARHHILPDSLLLKCKLHMALFSKECMIIFWGEE